MSSSNNQFDQFEKQRKDNQRSQLMKRQVDYSGLSFGITVIIVLIGSVSFSVVRCNKKMKEPFDPVIVDNGSKNGGESNFCDYPGCLNPASGFLNSGTGYCNGHARQRREEQKVIEKIENMGR